MEAPLELEDRGDQGEDLKHRAGKGNAADSPNCHKPSSMSVHTVGSYSQYSAAPQLITALSHPPSGGLGNARHSAPSQGWERGAAGDLSFANTC